VTDELSQRSLEHLLRDLTPQVLATVVRRFHDFDAAEDAVQDALSAAAQQWPWKGRPENPRAWLTRVAFRRMVDHIRTESARRRRESEVSAQIAYAQQLAFADSSPEQDDTLILLFMCCHPSLTSASAIAITLRAVGGLTTAEIAHAFLVPEATMAQRISRAKQTIKASEIPFQMPTSDERVQRLRSVLHVLYLIFNEGYTATGGNTLRRDDLSHEAIRIARLLYSLRPAEPEVAGLLALMLLTDARRLARTGPQSELIPLDRQDRSLWDRPQIAEGTKLISTAMRQGSIGPYQLQAAIAALHDEAPRAEQTDWPKILALYGLLKRMSDNPMVNLSHAIASAMVNGPTAGLRLLDEIQGDPRIAHRLDAARAHLLELSGDRLGAITFYRSAASKTDNLPERDYLLLQAARLSDVPTTPDNLRLKTSPHNPHTDA